MVELVGQMKNNLLVDFGIAKKIIKEVVNEFDHKFFINRKYLKKEDESHYQISFDGPKGLFDLQVPKHTTYLLEGEATVENLSSEIIKLLAPKMPECQSDNGEQSPSIIPGSFHSNTARLVTACIRIQVKAFLAYDGASFSQ